MTESERDLLVKTARALVGSLEVLKHIYGAALPGAESMQVELLDATNRVEEESRIAARVSASPPT